MDKNTKNSPTWTTRLPISSTLCSVSDSGIQLSMAATATNPTALLLPFHSPLPKLPHFASSSITPNFAVRFSQFNLAYKPSNRRILPLVKAQASLGIHHSPRILYIVLTNGFWIFSFSIFNMRFSFLCRLCAWFQILQSGGDPQVRIGSMVFSIATFGVCECRFCRFL